MADGAGDRAGRGRSWADARLFTLLAGASGFCALGYEVLYLRHLTVLLGDMMYVHAALLSAFLVGVAAGALLAHRFHGGLVYLEAATGVYALALPWATAWMGVQPWMATVAASPALTVGVTAALVVVPGVLVGFSMPLFSAYAKACRQEGLAFQNVYIVYNAGALLGIAVVELALVRTLGIRLSLAALAAVNLTVAAVLWAAGTRHAARPAVAPRRFARRLLAAVFLASLASAVFQMFFLKLTYLVFSPHRENFALAVGVSLLGITLGAWWASRTDVRVQAALAMVPLSLGAVYLAHPLLADLFTASYGQLGGTLAGARLTRFGFAAIYGLVPMLAFGAVLPALMRSESAVAEESGRLLFVSAAANAVGYLLYVFVVHPYLSGSVALAVMAALSAVAAILVLRDGLRVAEMGIMALGAVLCLALLVTWDDADFYLARSRASLGAGTEVETFKRGGEDASLVSDASGRWISYNGFRSVVVERHGVTNYAEMISGLIPALAAPRLDRALVLGLGTGITAGMAAQAFRHVDVVEINPAFGDMAPRLRANTFDVDLNPRVAIHLNDGRSFLSGKEGEYDAIVNSIPAPTYYSAGKIYTVEFYLAVRRALKPDGVFATWLSTGNMSPRGLETVMLTLAQVWPHCDLRPLRSNYYMATCGTEPPRARLAASLDLPGPVLQALSRSLEGFDPLAYLDDLRVSTDLLGGLAPGDAPLNTDDAPVLEYQVMDLLRPGPEPPDHLKVNPRRFGIDPTAGLVDPVSIARRAAHLSWVDPAWFDAWFRPLVEADPAVAAAWEARETGTEGGA